SKAVFSETEDGEEAMTAANVLVGSLGYMAPEQVEGSQFVDMRSDIWTLGICLFQMITGRHPFKAKGTTSLIVRITRDPPPSFQSLSVEGLEGVEKVILRCLEKDPERRYQTVAELARALQPFGTELASMSAERICQRAQQTEDIVPEEVTKPTPRWSNL